MEAVEVRVLLELKWLMKHHGLVVFARGALLLSYKPGLQQQGKLNERKGQTFSDPTSCYLCFVKSCGVWDFDAGASTEDSTEVSTI